MLKLKNGDALIRLGLGLLFVWGGVSKLFGILGGPGLVGFSGMLQSIGFEFLGGTTIILAIIIAVVELVGGLALIVNKKFVHASYVLLALVMLVALVLVHIGSGAWGQIMMHIAFMLTLGGLAINTRTDK